MTRWLFFFLDAANAFFCSGVCLILILRLLSAERTGKKLFAAPLLCACIAGLLSLAGAPTLWQHVPVYRHLLRDCRRPLAVSSGGRAWHVIPLAHLF